MRYSLVRRSVARWMWPFSRISSIERQRCTGRAWRRNTRSSTTVLCHSLSPRGGPAPHAAPRTPALLILTLFIDRHCNSPAGRQHSYWFFIAARVTSARNCNKQVWQHSLPNSLQAKVWCNDVASLRRAAISHHNNFPSRKYYIIGGRMRIHGFLWHHRGRRPRAPRGFADANDTMLMAGVHSPR